MDGKVNWAVVAAIGQVAGAGATFAAVVVSLYLAKTTRTPRVKFKVGEYLVLQDGSNDIRVLTFSIANVGERPVHVRAVGWKTGWLSRGPNWLSRIVAVQLTGNVGFGADLPFELAPGAEKSSYARMENVLAAARRHAAKPLFSRDYPLIGRRRTKVLASMHTAEGHTFYCRPEPSLIEALVRAERLSDAVD